jgi:hypothetical protein
MIGGVIVEKLVELRLAGETEVLWENLPQRHFCPSQNPTWPDPDLDPGRRGGKPATNRAACFNQGIRVFSEAAKARIHLQNCPLGEKSPVQGTSTCQYMEHAVKMPKMDTYTRGNVPSVLTNLLQEKTGYGLDWEVGVRVPVWSRIFSSPCCPDRLWGPPNLLYNGYRG